MLRKFKRQYKYIEYKKNVPKRLRNKMSFNEYLKQDHEVQNNGKKLRRRMKLRWQRKK